MNWITTGTVPIVPHPQVLTMLRRTVAEAPDDARRQRALARELFAQRHHREAIDAYERLLVLVGDLGEDWPSLAMAMLEVEGTGAVLDLAARRWAGSGTAAWHHARAIALRIEARVAEAESEFHRAIVLGEPGREAMRGLLRMHADRSDGVRLLAACDALPPAMHGYGLALGYRALALSLLGRDDEARALVDLDAGTMRFAFEPPRSTRLAAFNDALAEAVIADQPAGTDDRDILLNHQLGLAASAELAALKDFVAACYARYVERLSGGSFMPAMTGGTKLDYGAVTVRRGGRNGQHIHPEAYLIGVYHARVPPVAGGDAGALVTGVCDEIAPGHRAAWGQRVLPAEPGTLTIFPAHYFHDVRPTGVEEKRVVIVSDLMPA